MKSWYLLIFSVLLFSCKSGENVSFEKAWFYDDDLSAEKQKENISKYGGGTEYFFFFLPPVF